MADKAYEVDADMVESGVVAEEDELSAILKSSYRNSLVTFFTGSSGKSYGPAQHPNNKKLLENWKNSGALFATPTSNDDWYWLYAAVSCKCLLVTNDEMRDHLFQLLGISFFPKWKEKHQIQLSFPRHEPTLHMPPPHSIILQESEKGSWHVPTITGGRS
ncbi:hypothetical protein SO802_021788 [Lithocarpus litseifolius]|uniref:PRORP domain-containing protein n=1 Tax=Lithocarpus litseifolius TaxID=425828 RepID=A0AAW2CHT4_9ROSI